MIREINDIDAGELILLIESCEYMCNIRQRFNKNEVSITTYECVSESTSCLLFLAGLSPTAKDIIHRIGYFLSYGHCNELGVLS